MQERQGSVSSMADARARMVKKERERRLCKTLARGGFGLRRKVFDPASFEDRLQYARFLIQGRWSGGRAFECEAPYLSVPETVREKLMAHFLCSELDIAREPEAKKAMPAGLSKVVSLRGEPWSRVKGVPVQAENEQSKETSPNDPDAA